jgi:integrase
MQFFQGASMARTKGKPDFVHGPFRARGRLYCYFRKPGCERVALPLPIGSAEFWGAYQAALAVSAPRRDIGASRNKPGTVAALVAAYFGSAEFKHEIAEDTRRTRRPILNRFREEHGDKRVAKLKPEHVLAILDGKKPFARRNWIRALRPLMRFAVAIGWHTEDPTKEITIKLPRGREGFPAWGEDKIAIFRAHHPIGTKPRLALELLLNTVQRRGDVVHMGRQHIRHTEHGPALFVRQGKTGAELLLPIVPDLQAAIDATPSGHLAFLTNAYGRPFTSAAFGIWFRKQCVAAGLTGFTAHGLRKAGCRRIVEAGGTVPETAAWSGHRDMRELRANPTSCMDPSAPAATRRRDR